MQKKFEADMLDNEKSISIMEFEIIPSACASCTTQPNVYKFKQVNVDVILGDNPLQTVSKDVLGSCLTKYTLTFKDQDHSLFDAAYDVAHYLLWNRVTDIKVFYVSNGDVWFLDSGSKSETFYELNPSHFQDVNDFSDTVYVSNTWNHMMDTSNTNPSFSMKTWYK